MYCPNCGKADQSPETYCRQCGTFLIDFNKKKTSFGGETPQEQVRTNLVLSALSAVVSFACAIILFLTFLGRGSEFPFIYVVTGWLFALGIWQISNFLVSLKLRNTLKRGKNAEFSLNKEKYQTSDLNKIPQPDSDKYLSEGDLQNYVLASVTEETTKNFNKISRQ